MNSIKRIVIPHLKFLKFLRKLYWDYDFNMQKEKILAQVKSGSMLRCQNIDKGNVKYEEFRLTSPLSISDSPSCKDTKVCCW